MYIHYYFFVIVFSFPEMRSFIRAGAVQDLQQRIAFAAMLTHSKVERVKKKVT